MKKKYNFVVGLVLVFLLGSSVVFGQNEYAIKLDGDESFYVNDDGGNHLDQSGAYTYEAWIYIVGYTNYDRIMDRRFVMAFDICPPMGTGDFGIRFTERGANDIIYRTIKTDAADEDMNLNTWYHVAVTFDMNNCRLYVNGDVVAQQYNIDWSLTGSTEKLTIGGYYNSGYSNQINGYIDEVRYSNTARSSSDMQTSSNCEEYTLDANTILLMHLNDEVVSPTYVSGTGLTGTRGNDAIDIADYTSSKLGAPNYLLRPKYESQATGNWSALGTWKVEHGAETYVNATILPDQYTESITIKSGHTVTSVGDITIATDGKLEISGNLTANGTLTNNAEATGLVLKSTVTDQGSLIHSSASVDATAERQVTAHSVDDGWHLLSSPVDNFTITAGVGFEPVFNEDDLYYWDEDANTAGMWINYHDGGFTNFTNGQGYLCAYKSTSTKSFTGELNVSNITIPNLSADYGKWHLLGNPFACALEWNAGTWNTTDVSTPQVYDDGEGDYFPVDDVGYGNIIPSTQGFFVEVTDATNSITIPTDARVHNNKQWYKNTQENENTLCLKLSGGNDSFSSQTTIVFNPSSTKGYDVEFDSHKILGSSPAPKIYTIAGDQENFATNHIPPSDDEILIPTNTRVFSEGEYTINVKLNTVEREGNIYLEDLKTGVFTNLTLNDSYAFQASKGDAAERFILHFNSTTGIGDIKETSNVNIYANANSIYLNAVEAITGDVMVYNMGGKLILSEQVQNSNMHIISAETLSGVYLVRFIGAKRVSTQKVIIQ